MAPRRRRVRTRDALRLSLLADWLCAWRSTLVSQLTLPKQTSTPARPLRPTILTVDDSKTVRRLAQTALSDFDCDVNEADNGYKAFYAMDRVVPDLILLDVNMPTMDGVRTLQLIREHPQLKAILVIMLTSPADHNDSDEIAALGVSATLMKPFTPADLLAKIRGVIDLQPRS